ncbi:acyl-[acyl-carrier-protein] thioesterase [Fodinibius salsisoli]|uniref:Acyl-[acyl-carrier-protein] thioesterase n=1 Tax=Fodinibius salsisoli TaxID=2820877 RepID=A0ABT3PLK4_9BACT|nr:acyl-ACP thioesterase domain-containing protein [Fodinibius salsisoli]MCW9706830.1 acyl-[acyl-carrier-protein] thioesterase [Fodinibius salsisoli]
MSEENIFFEEQFKIRASEIGPNQKATLPAICNLLQEIAGNHARQLSFDITDLRKEQLTWVLHQLHVKIDRFPEWRETVTIKTWPSGGDGIRAYRDFLILDEKKHVIGSSLSYWLILDLTSRRPHRIPKKILDRVPDDTEHVLPITKEKFPELHDIHATRQFNVRKTDLDLNNHVNNVRYIEWALSNLAEEENISEINIKFIAESLFNDSVIAKSGVAETVEDDAKIHELVRKRDEKLLCRAITK